MITGSVARRYAKALSIIAEEKDLWDTMMEDLKSLLPVWESKEVQNFIHEPSLTRKDRAKILKNMAQEMGLSEVVVNFLEVLALKGRLEFLPDIVRELERAWEDKKNKIKVIVRTPRKLSDKLREKLQEAVRKKTGRDPVILEVIDEELIGGVSVEIGGVTYDGTVREMIKKIVELQEIKA